MADNCKCTGRPCYDCSIITPPGGNDSSIVIPSGGNNGLD